MVKVRPRCWCICCVKAAAQHGDTRLLVAQRRATKSGCRLCRSGCAGRRLRAGGGPAGGAGVVPWFPRPSLPFNEGTLLIGLRLNPGVTAHRRRWRSRPSRVKAVPEVIHVGRRSGRAELTNTPKGCTSASWMSASSQPAS